MARKFNPGGRQLRSMPLRFVVWILVLSASVLILAMNVLMQSCLMSNMRIARVQLGWERVWNSGRLDPGFNCFRAAKPVG